ncbi:hypothetical protein BT63DRAFT_460308 [Microthyrium microscopicum]|uniref:Uncharacterized protein n=1 Tax=Microthyrium microscopicum TaxID=703497 RepID=A0A6A6TVB0_9PEZI|nr:hypothetical protein BT63DRAFT_460308 [Microthyrium microscopicum]
MSGSQLLKTAVGIPIYLARQVTVKGQVVAYRLVDAIGQEQKDNAADKVATALEGNKMLPEDIKKTVKAVEITSMPHQSPMDPAPHISVDVQLESGANMKAHIPSDGSEQQVLRNPFTFRIIHADPQSPPGSYNCDHLPLEETSRDTVPDDGHFGLLVLRILRHIHMFY